jgi:heterodisulfide reductase subunit D
MTGFFDRFKSGNTLFYPGCLAKHSLKSIANNYAEILKRLGIDFILLKDNEVCCGYPALSLGYRNEFEDLKIKNDDVFRRANIKRIITSCPSCYLIFKKAYPNLKVEHITQVIARHLKELPVKYEEKLTYYDPPNLARKAGIVNEPRAILEALGYEVIELENNKEFTECCGAGGGLRHNLPQISNKIAKNLLAKVKTPKLITTDPLCYVHLKENSQKIEILELSQVLV